MRRLREERGAAAVEFALVASVLFLLIFGMAGYGIIELGNSSGSSAARDGARVGMIYYDNAENTSSPYYTKIKDAALKRLAGTVTNTAVAVKCLNGETQADLANCAPATVNLVRGDLIGVTVTWKDRGIPPFSKGKTHTATARMVIGGKPSLAISATSSTTTTSTTTTTTTAPTPPAFQSASMWDNDRDGRVDQVTVTFTGANLAGSCGSGWTLANIPSGGTQGAVSFTGLQATVNINEGTGAKTTAVGGLTVAFSSASCNASSFAAQTPTDRAGPVIVSYTDTAGATDGLLATDDTMDITFSEPVDPASAAASSAVVLARSGGATLSVPGVLQQFNTGDNKYLASNNTTVTFASPVTVSGATVNVKLGPCSGDCSELRSAEGGFTLLPATDLRDAAGNTAAGTYDVSAWKLF